MQGMQVPQMLSQVRSGQVRSGQVRSGQVRSGACTVKHFGFIVSGGLYYKPMTIVNDNSKVVSKFEASLSDDTRVVIYNCHMFIVQATGVFLQASALADNNKYVQFRILHIQNV